MKNYLVLTAIRGLRRVEGGKKRPIEIGDVVALPDAIAEGLVHLCAIEETDAEPTVELIFLDDDGAARALAADLRERDRGTLISAVADIGGMLIFPDDLEGIKIGEGSGVELIPANDEAALLKALRTIGGDVVVTVDDRTALVDALRDLGGDVVFPGEPLGRFAERLSNAELVAELAGRVTAGALPLHELPDSVTGKSMHSKSSQGGAGEAGGATSPAELPAAEAPPSPPKPATRAKAPAKPKAPAK